MRLNRPTLFDIEIALVSLLVVAGALSTLWTIVRWAGLG